MWTPSSSTAASCAREANSRRSTMPRSCARRRKRRRDCEQRRSGRRKRAVGGLRLRVFLVFLVQLLLGDLLFRHLGKLQQKVDDLLLVNRCADRSNRLRVLAVV